MKDKIKCNAKCTKHSRLSLKSSLRGYEGTGYPGDCA